MEGKELFVKEVLPGIFLLDEAHEATGYVVVGEERACVIDTMIGYNDLHQAVRKLTDKPLIVVNTHGHPDHIYGNMYFDEARIHPADLELAQSFVAEPEFQKMLQERHASFPPFRDILPGDVIDLGGRLWMQLDGCLPMKQFLMELDKVMFLEDRADVILHGHARDTDDISLLRCMRNGVEEICFGKTDRDQPYQWFGGTDLQHSFRCDPEKHYQQQDHVICYRASNI